MLEERSQYYDHIQGFTIGNKGKVRAWSWSTGLQGTFLFVKVAMWLKLNPFLDNVPFLNPLKTLEKQKVFRGYRNGTLA